MKIFLKPVTLVNHPEIPAIAGLTTKLVAKERAYTHLVTSHDVPPERVKQLLYGPEK